MMTDSSKCFACDQKAVEYIQIEDTLKNYALCKDCYLGKGDIKSIYLEKNEFLKKYEEEIKKEFPNLFKLLQFKQNTDKLLLWDKYIKPQMDDVLLFIKNTNYTQKNFLNLGIFFQKKGKFMENVASQILNYLYAQRFNLSNTILNKEQNQNDMFNKKFFEYLKEINPKCQDKMKNIEKEIENTFSKVPEQLKQTNIYLKNDEYQQKELNKYFGYMNLIDLKDGKGIQKNKDIIYYGIFDCDIFKYGVKFEQITQEEVQFFFGSFLNDEIEGNGKMIAYKFENQNISQKYEGNFENGLRNGEGKFIWEQNNKTIIYEGSWKKNLQHGDGKIIDQNANKQKQVKYEQGQLKEDKQAFNLQFNPRISTMQTNQLQQIQKPLFQASNNQFQQQQNQFPQQIQNETSNSQTQINRTQTFANNKFPNTQLNLSIQQQQSLQATQKMTTMPPQAQLQQELNQQQFSNIQLNNKFNNNNFNNTNNNFNNNTNNQAFQTLPKQIGQQPFVIGTQQFGNQIQESKNNQKTNVYQVPLNHQFQPLKKAEAHLRSTIGGISNSQTLNFE